MAPLPALIEQCTQQVPAGWLAAIIQNESRGNPLAININGGEQLAHQPTTASQAQATARWLIKNGYSFDAGIGQINNANFGRLGLNVITVFDPCRNIKAAASLFNADYQRSYAVTHNAYRAVMDAISMYNTGSRSLGYANGYVRKIMDTATGNSNIIPLKRKEETEPNQKNQKPEAHPQPADPYDVYNQTSRPDHSKVY